MNKLTAYPKPLRLVCFSTEKRMDFYFYLGWIFKNTMWYITISLFLHGKTKHGHGKAKNSLSTIFISYSLYMKIVGSYGLTGGYSACFFLIRGSRPKEWVLSLTERLMPASFLEHSDVLSSALAIHSGLKANFFWVPLTPESYPLDHRYHVPIKA